jgi:hypothetical protein
MYKLASLSLLVVCFSAHATSCFGPITVCSSFDANSIVFRGRVLEVIRNAAPEIPVTYPDGSSTTLYAGSMSEEVRFEVLETFKDLQPGTYTLTAVEPSGYTTLGSDTSTVTVAAKGCAEID